MSANFKTSIIRFKDADGNVLTIDALKGDTGDSGVHIGKTAPTDPLKSVWIDSSNTAQSVLNIKNGQNKWESVPAIRGTDGITPVRGKDYWTASDIAVVVDEARDAIEEAYLVFEVDDDGYLWMTKPNKFEGNFFLNDVGELIYEY